MLHKVVVHLDERDYEILRLLDSLSERYEYIPLNIIESRIGMYVRELDARLRKLSKLKVVKRINTSFTGYAITSLGLDVLALKDLSNEGIVYMIGGKIGTGKESDIYIAKNYDGRLIAIKFYKIGRSFKKTKRVRGYLINSTNWITQSKVAAEREYKALVNLIKYTPYVPAPLGWNRHAIVIDFIEGIELFKYRNALNPAGMLSIILSTLRTAFTEVGIVHSDLSEYNILVTFKGNEEIPIIIDWPQYVYAQDFNALDMLKRDVNYIVKFFRRRFKLHVDELRALNYVRGLSNEL